jgi:dTDP-4-dehydrorhamnose 3,5-epimerase
VAATELVETSIPGVLMVKPKRFEDVRGFFVETYNKAQLAELGILLEFVQDNLSYSKTRGTLRGLHFQTQPFAQDKLVSVIRGAVLDVAVDLRSDSPTFGKHVSARLDAAQGHQLFVPAGFAHGFLTLEPETLFSYKVTNFYAADHDRGIRWDDPLLGIEWGLASEAITLSDRDRRFPNFDPGMRYF